MNASTFFRFLGLAFLLAFPLSDAVNATISSNSSSNVSGNSSRIITSGDLGLLFVEDSDGCALREYLASHGVLDELVALASPGACSSPKSCSMKTCLNRLPLPCSLPYVNSSDWGQLGTSPSRTAGAAFPVNAAVMTMAAGYGYGAEWITSFVGTLRRTGYSGLIVVFLDLPPAPLSAALFTALDVETVMFNVSTFATSRLTAIRFILYEK